MVHVSGVSKAMSGYLCGGGSSEAAYELRRIQRGASNLVALRISYSCDQNGGKQTLRLAVHPIWKHYVETTAERETSGTDFRPRGDAKSRGPYATATGGKAKEVEFIRLEARSG